MDLIRRGTDSRQGLIDSGERTRSTDGHPEPTPNDWAVASRHTDRDDDPGKRSVFEIEKSETKRDGTFQRPAHQ